MSVWGTINMGFTHKQLEMLGYLHTTVATEALVLMHQATSIYYAD